VPLILANSLFVVIVLIPCLGGTLLVFPLHAQGQSSKRPPLLSPEPNRQIIIFDDDALEKMFGKSRRSTAHEIGPGKIPGRSDFPTVAPNQSLLSAIDRRTNSKRAAALRLAESGRILIQAGESGRAISVLERALSLEASPFVYFYLARAHHHLADYQRAAQFGEIAEALLYEQPDWNEELLKMKAALSAPHGSTETRSSHIGWGMTAAR
jgi:tetratricopeptide (TPR) repeat protein